VCPKRRRTLLRGAPCVDSDPVRLRRDGLLTDRPRPAMSQWDYNHAVLFHARRPYRPPKNSPGLSDKDAMAKAHALFLERAHLFDGYEVWNRTRVLIRHPKRAPQANNAAVWPLHGALRGDVSLRSVDSPYKPNQPLKPSPKGR
jgi:hypothetical protein